MQGNSRSELEDPAMGPWWKTINGVVMCGFLLVAGFYLVLEHSAHVFGVLPFLLILACPLMHMFHHHGHRHIGGSRSGATSGQENQRDA